MKTIKFNGIELSICKNLSVERGAHAKDFAKNVRPLLSCGTVEELEVEIARTSKQPEALYFLIRGEALKAFKREASTQGVFVHPKTSSLWIANDAGKDQYYKRGFVAF